MRKLRAYLQAAHFGPTVLITAISFVLATRLWWEGPAYVIAFTVFLGQLLIGWSNDLYDYDDDLKHQRTNKPLVAGTITFTQLRKTTFILLPFAFIANLIGPLGIKGGLVYLLGVGCGIAYNFYFKYSRFSPLPYAIACAALPASVFFAIDRRPPLWVLAVGAMLGVAFHFVNVIKDLDQDRTSQIAGLPQILGRKISITLALLLVTASVIVFANSPASKDFSPRESSESVSSSVFTVGGDRPTFVTLPSGYLESKPAPLIIDLHGYMSTSINHQRFAMMDSAANKRGVIYAAPDGLPDSQGYQFWNASNACCNFYANPVDDAAFIQSLIDEISSKVSVDLKRIYVFGHSNGHFMTYKFACTHPQTVAAIAGLAGAMDIADGSCGAQEPVSVLHIHGTSDEVINYSGAQIFGNLYTGAEASAKRWAKIDKCSLKPAVGAAFDLVASLAGAETVPTVYTCPEAAVELWTITGGAHGPVLDSSFGLKVMDWLLAHPKK
jgi:poly(3-hydroxybutyrate) depolymerase